MFNIEKTTLKEKYNNDFNEFYKNEYPVSYEIWEQKYKFKNETVTEMWKRVAKAVAQNEDDENGKKYEKEFYSLLKEFKYLPGGRILSNAGTGRKNTTLINCYVENLEDEVDVERMRKDFIEFANKKNFNELLWYVLKTLNQYIDKESLRKYFELMDERILNSIYVFVFFKTCGLSAGMQNAESAIKFLLKDDTIHAFKKLYVKYEADSMNGIMQKASNWALTLRTGGGVGGAFSNLRPHGAYVEGVDSDSSGALMFMRIYDQLCKSVKSAGARRGAMMAVFHINHPDVIDFISSKKDNWDIEKLKVHIQNMNAKKDEKEYFIKLVDNAKSFTQFNISVGVTNEFMECVAKDLDWNFKWDGKETGKSMKARELWDMITTNTYQCSEPGVLFIDRINQMNNLWFCEDIRASNPCGEQMLSNGSVCCLGSFNLAEYIKGEPFTDECQFDFEAFKKDIPTAVRFQDNVLDITYYPLQHQIENSLNKRRIGIGITGLADLFCFMKMRYGSIESIDLIESITKVLQEESYRASALLAKEKGAFVWYKKEYYMESPYIQNLPEDIKELIKNHGMRNSHVGSVQPCGTISFVSKNISSSLEPIFMNEYDRYVKTGKVDPQTGIEERRLVSCQDYAYKVFKTLHPKQELPEYFVNTENLNIEEHLNIEIAIARYIDSAISKTINIPNNYDFEKFKNVYKIAYDSGVIKGVTTYRDGSMAGVLIKTNTSEADDYDALEEAHKRPKMLMGMTKKIKEGSGNYYITVNLHNDKPYELICTTNGRIPTSITEEIYDALVRLAKKKKIKEKYLKEQLDKGHTNVDKVTRLISLSLRHGITLQSIMVELDNIITPFNSVAYWIKKTLGEFIQDGTKVNGGRKCDNCKSEKLVFQSGCVTCANCSWSAC